jgi:hypothetical protein
VVARRRLALAAPLIVPRPASRASSDAPEIVAAVEEIVEAP